MADPLGAYKAGEDMEVGRTNRSEVRTILVASRDEGEEAPNGLRGRLRFRCGN